MDLACSSQSYDRELRDGRLSLPEWCRLCAEDLGVSAVELEDKHVGEPTLQRLAEIREAAARYELSVVNIALMNNFGVADDTRRREEAARTVAWMDVARALRSRYLRTFAGWPEGDRSARWPGMVEALRTVCARAEALGVRLVLENHNHAGFVQTGRDVEEILEAVHSPVLGLLLDTGNYVDGMASIVRTASRAWHVHAKFTEVGRDGRDARVDHDAVVGVLREAGYAGCVSIEYEGAEPGRTAVPRIASYLRALLFR